MNKPFSHAVLHPPVFFSGADHIAYPAPGKEKESGFTLIEMLVVLMIMGLLIGLVSVIAQPDDRAQLRVEAERLAQLMDLAATESQLGGKPVAWTADAAGYRFWRFSEASGWSELSDATLHARLLPKGMTISNLRVENMKAAGRMRVEFHAYGSAPVFSLEMTLGEARLTVENSPIGEIRILPEGRRPNDRLVQR
ncbi:MAG TPA: GspH/FimT family pseudopilin [Gallionella sp.]|nr:GspH/FimT family pseudopilin [Gallionella sp.]